jgi:hypothetical protein
METLVIRPPAAAAHLGGDLRLRRQRADRDVLLRRPAHLPRAAAFGGSLAWFVFWGYQLFIVLAATGYLLGITQGKEYAEPEWYVDLWLTVVWVAYLIVFMGTLVKRKEPHIYVANWFYLASSSPSRCCISSTTWRCRCRSRLEEVAFRRRAGCADAVVVRPQRGGLLPDRRLPRR